MATINTSEILVVTPCGKKKQPISCPARTLYQGAYFTACLKWALSVVPASRVRILSGKYGLLPLEKTINPYNAVIGDVLTSVTIHDIIRQAKEQGIGDVKRVICLGGVWYQWMVKNAWPQQAEFPFYSGGGMFTQMQVLTANRGRLPESWKKKRLFLKEVKERASVSK